MSVQLLVLTSGEKLICGDAAVSDNDPAIMTLHKPLALKEMMSQEGISYVMIPFLPTKIDSIEVSINNIAVLPAEADPKLADYFLAQTSGLVLPSSNKIEKLIINK
jgi:hypothetical protein